jgi:hypothetical protein
LPQTLDLFNEAKVEIEKPEPSTTWQAGSREIRLPIRRQRKEAVAQLREILKGLEGKDIFIGSYHAGGRHYWLDNLKLSRLVVENLLPREPLPSVIVLWGSRGACVRIFTDFIRAVRVQEYQGYWLYLVDFRNGTWEYPIDNYRSHYNCLQIVRYKD